MEGSFDKLRTSSFGKAIRLGLRPKAQDGQTLIEVLVALGTAVVVLSATVVAVLVALNNAQFSKNQNIATQYAQQGMEVMRKMRNSNWSAFNDLNDSYCLAKDDTFLNEDDEKSDSIPNGCSTGEPSYPNPNVDNIYARQVDIEEDSSSCGGSQAKVTVLVSWASNKCTGGSNLYCHKVELVSCLGDSLIGFTPLITPALTPTPTPVNLLANPGFESQLSNWTCTNVSYCVAETDPSRVYSGAYSGKLITINMGGAGWEFRQGGISVNSRQERFCLSAWVKKQNASTPVIIGITSEGPTVFLWDELSAINTTNWQQVRGTVITPSSSNPPSLQVDLRRSDSGDHVWFDDVSLIRGPCS